MTLLLLNIRFPDAHAHINHLIEINLIKHNKDTDQIVIQFLDEKFKQEQKENSTFFSLIKEWIRRKIKA